ncbi:hypothetical protein EDD16DRAFT_1633881 [Pisolithus croceorrhizus]|nr:hypothetical protein EDD16DRAFT_1633881 [Pisolithus croceorrhizus]
MFDRGIGGIIPIGIKIPWRRDKPARTPHNFSVAVPPTLDQQPPTGISSSSTSQVPFFRNISDVTQITLPVVRAAIAAIPGIGAPLAAAIDGLVVVVQVIDRQIQNREALDSLTRRLYTLCCHIANAPAARTPFEDVIRRDLIKVLEDTTQELWKMRRRIPGSARLTQDIAGCFSKINDALVAFTAFSNMQLMQAMSDLSMRHLPAVVSAGCVVLVDATGEKHNMLLEHCCSFEQLRCFLPGILSKCRPDKAHIQQWYIDRGQYDFAIDDGTNITQLARESDIWSTIQPGTKIIMRVIITELSLPFSTGCKCQCGTWNEVNVDQATVVDALNNDFTITW